MLPPSMVAPAKPLDLVKVAAASLPKATSVPGSIAPTTNSFSAIALPAGTKAVPSFLDSLKQSNRQYETLRNKGAQSLSSFLINNADPSVPLKSALPVGVASGNNVVFSSKDTSITTPTQFATSLLKVLGIAPNANNVNAIQAWARAEGGHWHNSAAYNPLNTTQNAAGATSMNGVGVKAYKNWQQGLNATIQTLNNGRYGNILNALRSGSAYDIAKAVQQSPWGTKSGVLTVLGY